MNPEPAGLFDVPEEWWHRRRCQVCGCALSLEFTHTYVVQRQWWIKIGATNMPRRRVNELSRPAWAQHILHPAGMDWTEPLTVHAIVERNVEHQLHALFADHHVVGEWFEFGPEIRRWVQP